MQEVAIWTNLKYQTNIIIKLFSQYYVCASWQHSPSTKPTWLVVLEVSYIIFVFSTLSINQTHLAGCARGIVYYFCFLYIVYQPNPPGWLCSRYRILFLFSLLCLLCQCCCPKWFHIHATVIFNYSVLQILFLSVNEGFPNSKFHGSHKFCDCFSTCLTVKVYTGIS